MEFEINKAKQIIADNKLSESTLRVWQNRGKIPDKYMNAPILATKVEHKEDVDRMILKIEHEAINKEILFKKLGINKVFADVKRGQTSFTLEEIAAIKKEFAQLRVQINNALNSKSMLQIKNILTISYLKYRPIFARCDKSMYDRFMKQRETGYQLNSDDYFYFKESFLIFISQI